LMTLNVLEDYLRDFQGCVIIVSHDRYFMDKIVDSLFILEKDGNIWNFPGTYSQLREKKLLEQQSQKKVEKPQVVKPETSEIKEKTKLSFKERQEYEQLTAAIEELEKEKQLVYESLSVGHLKGEEIVKASKRYEELAREIEQMGDRWLFLSEFA